MRRRGVAEAAVCLTVLTSLVVAGVPVTAAGASPVDDSSVSTQSAPPTVVDTVANETNTTQHENPDDTGESGDLEEVQTHLADQLSRTLAERTVSLTRGEYEAANESLGEFDSQLSKYVDVAGETGRDGGSGEQFEEARDRQREFGRELRAYRETRAAYERAVENGNETRSRALARRLARQAENVTETGDRLDAALENVSETADSDTDQPREAEASVEQVVNSTAETSREVTEREFTETQVRAQSGSERASFDDPLRVTGRLTTADGTALRNRTVVVDGGRQSVTVTTDAAGRFTATLRPTTLRVGSRSVTVSHRPAADSIYLGSNASVTAEIEQTTGTVRVETRSEAGYGETLPIGGNLTVADAPVGGFPLEVRLGGRRLGTTTTDGDGSFVLSAVLPAGVSVGDRTVTVVPAVSGRAVTAPTATTTVSVVETATELDTTVEKVDETTVELFGVLQTPSGTPIPDRRVTVQIDGQTVRTLSTADGRFAAILDLRGVQLGDTVTITVTFDGTGTNLGQSVASRQVVLTDGTGTDDAVLTPELAAIVAGAGLVAVGSLLASFLVRRARREPDDDTRSTQSTDGRSDVPTASDTAIPSADDDTRAAVTLAVAELRTSFGVSQAATYRDLERQVDDERRDQVSVVLDTYERLTFAQGAVDPEQARRAVEAARDILGDE